MTEKTVTPAEYESLQREEESRRQPEYGTDPWITIKEAAERIPVDRTSMLRAVQRAERKHLIVTAKLPGLTGTRLVRESDVHRLYPNLQRHAAGRRPMSPDEVKATQGTDTLVPGTAEQLEHANRKRSEQ